MSDNFNKHAWRSAGSSRALDIDQGLRSHMVRVFMLMAMGLGVTGLVAFFAASSQQFMVAVFTSPLKWVVMLAPLGMVFFLSARISTLRLETAQILFWVYAALMGVSLSTLFVVFTGESIARLFFITGSVFGAMALYGYTTNRDLTQFGSFLMMGLLGIIVASVVNIFLHSSAMQMVVSTLGVLIFTGLTAYDAQQIKESYLESDSVDTAGKKAIIGALMLYLDFINLFISLMHLFGERR
jgi:uncharacterized protein